MITQERLKEVLHYDPETGAWRWLKSMSSRIKVGDVAGSTDAKGYTVIGIDGTQPKAHRLAWLYMTGEWPQRHLDHKNGDRADCRWANLREATMAQNNQNCRTPSTNKSGYKGVAFHKATGKWRASISVNNYPRWLGLFESPEAAHQAYAAAAEGLYGEFARLS